MSVDYQNSILWRGEQDPLKRKFQPKVDKTTRVQRYFAGKTPIWAPGKEAEEKEEKEPDLKKDRDSGRREKRKRAAAEVLEPAPRAASSRDAPAANSRLARLSAAQPVTDEGRSERLHRHRSMHEVQILEASSEDRAAEQAKKEEAEAKVEDDAKDGMLGVAELAAEAEDMELLALRRERIREVALLRRKEEEEQVKEEAVQEEEESSEDESESDDEDPQGAAMLRPVFVTKANRETVKEKEALKREEEQAAVRAQERVKEKKDESKVLMIDQVKRDDEMEREGFNENDASDIELIDDDDEKNEAEEYELWKIRELKRIKRDKEERLEREKELEFIERRRAMTEEEREADDRRLDAESNKKDEAKNFSFLQKYYHRGGFFQDKAAAGDEPLYLRDYHEPLEEEKYDKQLLPKAMQLRRGQFGKKGQVKHTHLTDVDTTDFQAAWSQHSKQVQKYQEKMAGASGVNNFSRPSASSKG